MPEAYVSVDLGGTNIACAIASEDMQLLAQTSVPTQSHLGPEGVVERIGETVASFCEEQGLTPVGMGIGVPGLADIARGQTLFLPNLPTQWRGVEVAKPLAARLGCPVSLLNDARMAALGELRFGAGKEGASTFAFFTLGTGIGGGIAIDGKLRLGPLGAAAELGHQTVLPYGPACGCGSRGCLETLASGPALVGKGAWLILCGRAPKLRELVNGDLNRLTPGHMLTAANEGDEAVRAVLVEAAEYLGIGVANIITALHPTLVVIGGGVAKMGDLLFDTVRATVRDRVKMFPPDDVQIRPSELGDAAGTWGGLALARDGLA